MDARHDKSGKPLANKCLECGYTLDAATGAGHDERPAPGDISICLECCSIAVFDENCRLREPTIDERFTFVNDHPDLIKQIKKLKRRMGR